jgi:hypothetical protein
MKNAGVVIAAALALQILLCACTSSDRMVRLSPFGEAWTEQDSAERGRLNLWPLFFRNDRFLSVFWPLIDSDDRGIAVRPFYNREGADYAILYPLSSWNPVTGEGHALNVYWSASDLEGVECYGIFPVFQHSPGFRQWLVPLYFHQETDRGQTWLTPLFGFGTTDGNLSMFNLLLPVYYFHKDAERKEQAFCWPLFYHELKEERERYHLLPLYSHDTAWPALVNWTWNEPISSGSRDNFNILGPFAYQHTIRTYTPPHPLLPPGRLPSGERKTDIAKTDEEDFILFGLFSWGSEHYLTWLPEHEPLLSELSPILLQCITNRLADIPSPDEKITELLQRLPEIPPDTPPEEIANILMHGYTVTSESRYHQLAPFYRYRFYQGNYHWSSLFGLLASGYRDRERHAEGIRVNPFFSSETVQESTEFTLLWPLFRRHATAKEEQISFFWRIFNYEKTGEKTSGHIFFIPW